MPESFRQYAKYYDLINKDKPYAQEVAYIVGRLRRVKPGLVDVLELGSGTGRHGRLLAEQGLNVHGIEQSMEMVEVAEQMKSETTGSFSCHVGDIRTVRLNRKFDAVVSLFHVMSYQTTDPDFAAAVETAACHLDAGGLFLFDVWHGPAVLHHKPTIRERSVAEGELQVIRKATPELRAQDRLVCVHYQFTCTDRQNNLEESFAEEHVVRYFFPEEIAIAAEKSFEVIAIEEMLTAAPPSDQTWAVTYLLRRR